MTPRDTSSRSVRILRSAFGLGLLAAALTVVPAACFFPDFTFNETTGGGTTSIGGGGNGGSTTTHTGGSTGGTTTTTTTTTTTGGSGGDTGGTTMTVGGAGGETVTGGSGGETTTSSTTSSTTSTTSTTTSSSTNPVENCQNGIDDDGDGLIDCKDTADCADFTCVSSVPNGWSGYFEIFQGVPAQDPGCSADYPMDGYAGNYNLNAASANCNACLCGAPQQQTCSVPGNINVQDAACNGSPTTSLPLTMPAGWSGTCASPVNANGPYYYGGGFNICGADGMQPCNLAVTADAPAVTGGFCASSGGGGMVPNAFWEGFVRACNGANLMGTGCNLSQKCLPKPKDPYSALICIKRSGDFNCPAGQFSQKLVFYDDFTDSRMCSPCSCDSPMGSTCAGNVSVYGDTFANSCAVLDSTFPAGGCGNLAGNPAVGPAKFTQTMPPTGGTCAPQGGQPTGQATKTFPQTFCCLATQ